MPDASEQATPPRAFTQGLGTVFQFIGVILFLSMMSICCGSSLLSKDTSERQDLTHIGWHFGRAEPVYSAQQALAVSIPMGVMLGVALAALGLGLQATHRRAPLLAMLVTAGAAVFWLIQTIFVVQVLHAFLLGLLGAVLMVLFAVLTWGARHAYREMAADPPPTGHEILPADYQVPYSHQHQDPPEVRLAAELAQRRQKLAVQQKELEMLEEKLKKTNRPRMDTNEHE